MDTLEPIPASSLRDSVLLALRRAILDGRLPTGSRLSESDLSRAMGASRSPIREAIAQLEKEGLAERQPNRGAFVAEVFSRQAIAELASVRSVLECFAAERAVINLDDNDLTGLYACTVEMEHAAARRQHSAIGDADFRFHEALVAMAGNRTLLRVWQGIASHYWEIYLPRIQALERDIDHWGENHRLIVDALRDRRADLAVMYLQFNILNSAEQLRDLLPGADGPKAGQRESRPHRPSPNPPAADGQGEVAPQNRLAPA